MKELTVEMELQAYPMFSCFANYRKPVGLHLLMARLQKVHNISERRQIIIMM